MMLNDIKIVRMNSGEEVICEIKEMSDTDLTIENPTIIIPTQDRNIGLAPWMPYAKTDKMTIQRSFVAFMVDPVDALANQYKSIHSKIITPTQSIVV